MFLNKYPYTDFHELNLDWILQQIKNMDKSLSEFEALNKITFDGEWDITKQYPAWCIVNTNGGTEGYISIQPVPAGVVITNTDYWVGVVNYTATIADLQNRVVQLESDVVSLDARIDALESIENRNYIVMTDSYGNHTNADGRNFIEQAFHELGITSYYDFHLGSAGFSRPGSLNFLSVLQANESTIPDKTKITDIIVCGGANDQIAANISDVLPGIQTFMAYVKANYPNATVHIGHFTNSIDPALIKYWRTSVNLYKESPKYGVHYMENSQYIMIKLSFFDNDNVHPSVAGVNALTKYLIDYIVYGQIDVIESATGCLDDGDNGTIVYDHLTQYQHNANITFRCQGMALGDAHPNSAISITTGSNTINNVLSFKDGFCYGVDGIGIGFNGYFGVNGGIHCPALFFVREIDANKVVKIGIIAYSSTTATVSGNFYLFMPDTSFECVI